MVSRTGSAGAVRAALATGTLHAWASRQPGAEPLAGRGTAWGVTLHAGDAVVVRRSRHGGALAPVTGDLFLAPTRAPQELANALRLASAGVPTPEVVAYAVYPAFWRFARADVVTRRIAGRALPEAWRDAAEPARGEIVRALATLLGRLRDAGARHPDLNLRNVLIAQGERAPTAFVLDVDRIVFGAPGSRETAERNLARILRSADKRRDEWGVDLRAAAALRVLSSSVTGEPDGRTA